MRNRFFKPSAFASSALLINIMLFLTIFKSSDAFAYNRSLQYETHNLENIPENEVNCIYKDSKGFMWIGTLDGLHRYDGYEYKTYRVDPNKNSISSNMIITITEDLKGNIWIGTYGKGICKLDPITDTFTSYSSNNNAAYSLPNDVTEIKFDQENQLWFCNWFFVSRIRFDKNMDKIKTVDTFTFNGDNTDKFIKTLYIDKLNRIWIGTNQQVLKISDTNQPPGKIKHEAFNKRADHISGYNDAVVFAGDSIWSFNTNNGKETLHLIAPHSGRKILHAENKVWSGDRDGLRVFEFLNNKWTPTEHFKHDFSSTAISNNIVYSIADDNLGNTWVGTRGGGVDIISPKNSSFSHYTHSLSPKSLSNKMVRSVFEDSNHNLWIGTEEGGVNFLSHNKHYYSGFEHIKVNETPLENRAYAFEEIKTPNSKRWPNLIYVGTCYHTCLAAINPTTQNIIKLPPEASQLGFIFTLKAQNDSILWAGTYNSGLWRISLNKDGIPIKYKNFTPVSNSNSTVLSVIIRDLFFDSKGNLWIATDKGINKIDKEECLKDTPVFKRFVKGDEPHSLSHDYILQIHENKFGKLYFGSMGGGLIECSFDKNKKKYQFKTIGTKQGLPNNSIKSITEDNEGNLWLASNKGLSKYNPQNGTVKNFDKSDGLQDNEFGEITAIRRRNGEMIFGGINGISVFHPQKIKENTSIPKMFFTDFYIQNKQVTNHDTTATKHILTKTLEYTQSVKLNYNHNSFSVGFGGLNYNSPQKMNYVYKLEGFDKEWYKASPEYRIAKYTNIPDGDYTFKVKASNDGQLWSKPLSLQVQVYPPLYRSWQAFVLYSVLLVLLFITIYRIMHIIALRKHEVKLAQMEKNRVEELSKMKLQFFTNISHEFRTPLTLIKTPLEQIVKSNFTKFSREEKYNISLIKYNVGVMMRLVNQLLDFRKLDQNKLKLKLSEQNLNQLIEPIFHAFEVMAQEKNITFNFKPTSDTATLWLDFEKIEKVIYNLLSNALKFTPSGGLVSIEIEHSKENQRYLIKVVDTGIGIDTTDAQQIFERYYQSIHKNNKHQGGTGIGLALCKGIVDLHKGIISYTPNNEKGSVFTVELKEGKAHYGPDACYINPFNENSSDDNVEPYLEKPEINTQNNENLPQLLIVEDNADLRHQIRTVFSTSYQIIEAEDGLLGLNKCKQFIPDVIISDIMMPNMDGIEMCEKIKADEATSHIPILVLTAKNTEETQISGYHLGIDSFIPKPFSIDVLKAGLEALMRNRERLKTRFQKEIEINPMIISNTPADTNFMDTILKNIESNLSNSDYTVESLAKDYGVSRIYLNKKIKGLTGETAIEFIRNIRLKHAAELLKQNQLSVAEVTWEVGYNDLRTFRKWFKEKFGVSPSEYTQQFKVN